MRIKSKSCFSSLRFIKVWALRFFCWLFKEKLPALRFALWNDSLFVKVISFHYWFSFFLCLPFFLYIALKIFKSLIVFPQLLPLPHLLSHEFARFFTFFFFRGSLHFPRICWHGNLYQKWISNSVNKVIVERERRERVNRRKLVVWEEDFAHT